MASPGSLLHESSGSSPIPPQDIDPRSAIKEPLIILIIVACGSGILIPVLISLFFFSTPSLRRKPVFILNVVSVMFGIGVGCMTIFQAFSVLQGEFLGAAAVSTATEVLGYYSPFIADSILLFRVFAVYPPSRMSKGRSAKIYIPLCLIKVARLVNMIICTIKLYEGLAHTANAFNGVTLVHKLPYAKVEWFLGTFDIAFTSTLFLLRLYWARSPRPSIAVFTSTSQTSPSNSYFSRIRTLFWIAVSNFVIPVIFNILLIVFSFRGSDVWNATYIFFVTVYVAIISALLATLWCSSTHWMAAGDEGDKINKASHSTFVFAPGSSTISWSAEVNSGDNA